MRWMPRLLFALALAASLACAARAEGWKRAYGGRGEDRLTELAPAPGGLLAVGTSFSSDGDLSDRTRSGETGWALRVDAEGNVLFSVSSAHAGRARMEHPFAHADGSFSCVLRGDGAGAEWLRLSERGRVTARIELPEASALCAHDPAGEEPLAYPCDLNGAAALALCVRHADGGFCFPAMDEAGQISPGGRVLAGEDPLVRVGAGGDIALVWAQDGAARVASAEAGGQTPRVFAARAEGVNAVLDALVGEDGSVILSASAGAGGLLARVSASGETLFCVRTQAAADRLALTDTGFAASAGEEWLFFDEDGALLSAQPKEARRGEELAIAGLGTGVAALSYLPDGAQAKQAQIAAWPRAAQAAAGALAGALYTRADSSLLAAQAVPEGALLLVRDGDGQLVRLLVDEAGLSREDARQARRQNGGALVDGELRWEADEGGALVTRYGSDGAARWQTHTPIYTAADRLEWRCAAQGEQGLLLGGRYVTGAGEDQAHQAVVAWLGLDGVLRRIETVKGAADICAMLESGGEVYLLAAREEGTADAVFPLSGGETLALGVPLASQDACLLEAPDGALLAAGTARQGGRSAVVVQAVPRGKSPAAGE